MKKSEFKVGDRVRVGPYEGHITAITIRANDARVYAVSYWNADGQACDGGFYDFELSMAPQERLGFKK